MAESRAPWRSSSAAISQLRRARPARAAEPERCQAHGRAAFLRGERRRLFRRRGREGLETLEIGRRFRRTRRRDEKDQAGHGQR